MSENKNKQFFLILILGYSFISFHSCECTHANKSFCVKKRSSWSFIKISPISPEFQVDCEPSQQRGLCNFFYRHIYFCSELLFVNLYYLWYKKVFWAYLCIFVDNFNSFKRDDHVDIRANVIFILVITLSL